MYLLNMEHVDYVNVNPLPENTGSVESAAVQEEQTAQQEGNVEPATSAVDSTETSAMSVSDEEAAAKAQELMRLMSDPNVLKAYRNIRSDVYGKKRQQVSKKDAKKKKAKRRMAKKSRRG
jgi:hypothetical protein